MTIASQAPEVFDNLIEASGQNLGQKIQMAEPAETFPGNNAQGVINSMSFSEIATRAKAFGQRCVRTTA